MGVRIVDRQNMDNVIPLYPAAITSQTNGSIGEATTSLVDDPLPEPAMLYGLTVLAFLLHKPAQLICRCVRCGTPWPCDHLRLAYRLREGF
jgi:hypothetical protein